MERGCSADTCTSSIERDCCQVDYCNVKGAAWTTIPNYFSFFLPIILLIIQSC
jgi:hypothetical protein